MVSLFLALIKRPSGTGCPGLIKTCIGLDKTAVGGDKLVYGQHNGAIKWSTSDEIVYGLPWLHKTSIGLIKRQSGAHEF